MTQRPVPAFTRCLAVLLTLVCSCADPEQQLPFALEELAGAQAPTEPVPARGLTAVRFFVGDLRIAFFVAFSAELEQELANRDAWLDVERALLEVDGRSIPLSDLPDHVAEDLPHREWIIVQDPAEARTFHLDGSESPPEYRSRPDDIKVGYPEGVLTFHFYPGSDRLVAHPTSLTLDFLAAFPDEELPGGGGFTPHDAFTAPPEWLIDADEPTEAHKAFLSDVDLTATTHDVVLGNLHGLFIDQGDVPAVGRELDDILNYARDDDRIAWEYLFNGCNSRAFLMNDRLAERGVRAVTVYVNGDLEAVVDGARFGWTMHAAPGLFVRDNGTLRFVVFDPAFSTQPLSLSSWLAGITPARGATGRAAGGKVQLDVMPSWQWQPPGYYGFAERAASGRSRDGAWINMDSYRADPTPG